MRNLIYTVSTGQTTTADGAINLGAMNRRYGCALNLSAPDTITISKCGYYKIDGVATVSNSTTSATANELYVTQNGTRVPGIIGGTTIAASGTAVIPFGGYVRVYRNGARIQVLSDIAGVTVDNLAVTVTEV